MQASRAIRFGLVVMSIRPIGPAMASTPAKSRVGAPASQSSPKRIAVRMIAVPMSPPSMISPSSMKADRHERHQHVLPLGQQPLVLFAGEQIGAPQDERELAELAGLELERAAEVDPVLVAVDRHALSPGSAPGPSGRRSPASSG